MIRRARAVTGAKWGPALFLFLVAFLLYSLTLSNNLEATHDSLMYLQAIDGGRDLFHPHHLLYNWFNWFIVGLARTAGYSGDSAVVVEYVNVVFGSLAIAVFYRLARRLLQDTFAAMASALLLISTFGFWFYSVSVEVYIIPMLLVLLSITLVWPLPKERTNTFVALAGTLTGMACLFHQTHILFSLVGVATIATTAKSTWRNLLKLVATFLVSAVLAAVTPYAFVMWSQHLLSSMRGAITWITLYLTTDHYRLRGFGHVSLSSFPRALIGIGRAIIGGHFLFRLDRVSELLEKIAPRHFFGDEQFLVRSLSQFDSYILLALAIVVFALLGLGVSLFFLAVVRRNIAGSTWVVICLWLACYGLLALWWEPDNLEFWIPLLPPICILLSAQSCHPVLRSRSRLWSSVHGCLIPFLALCVGFTNLFGSILPLHNPENSRVYSKGSYFVHECASGDLLIVSRWWQWGQWLRRYSSCRVYTLDELLGEEGEETVALNTIRQLIDQTLASGSTVFISDDAIHPEPTSLRLYPRLTTFADVWREWEDRWDQQTIDNQTVYILRR